MLLLLLSRGGSSRLFNHGDRIICIYCFKCLEITRTYRKCVSGMEQLAHGLEPATLSLRSQIQTRRVLPLRHNCFALGPNFCFGWKCMKFALLYFNIRLTGDLHESDLAIAMSCLFRKRNAFQCSLKIAAMKRKSQQLSNCIEVHCVFEINSSSQLLNRSRVNPL